MSGALREILAKFSIEIEGAEKLHGTDKGVEGLKGSLEKLGLILGAGVIFEGLKHFVEGLAETGDQINDTSAQLGLGTDEFQQWGLAAKLSGAEAQDFATAVKLLEKNMADAATAGSPQAAAFKKLGIELKDSTGQFRDTGDVLAETGIAIAKLGSPAERTKAALELFGKAGTKLLPMFADGEEGLQKLLAQFHELGGGYSKEALEQMGRLGDETDKYNFALTSLKSQIALQILPTINDLISKGSKLAGSFKLTAGESDHLKIALITLGSIGLIAGAEMAAPYILMGLTLAAIVLLVDDVVTAIKGGDSVTGDLLDKLMGKGAGKGDSSIFVQIKQDIRDLRKEINDPMNTRSGPETVIDRIGASLGKVPGEVKQAMQLASTNVMAGTANWAEYATASVSLMIDAVTHGTTNFSGALMGEVTSSLAVALFSIPARMMALGDRIMQSLADGIAKGAHWVVDAAKKVADKDVTSTILDAFGMHSPSLVMLGIGGHLTQSLATGLTKGSDDVRVASAMMVAPVFRAMAPLGAGGPRNIAQSYSRPSQFKINVSGGSVDSVRQGLSLALDDDREATLAALEATA
jgi:hypothetical protein